MKPNSTAASEELSSVSVPHLAERFYDGDDDSFKELHGLFAGLVLSTARGCLNRHYRDVSPEDIAQITWMRVCQTRNKHFSRWDPAQSGFATWLTRVAKNAAIDQIRRNRARPESAIADIGDVPALDLELHRQIRIQEIFEYIRTTKDLTVNERKCLLFMCDGYTAKEIAVRTGAPITSVPTYIARAKKIVISHFREHDLELDLPEGEID